MQKTILTVSIFIAWLHCVVGQTNCPVSNPNLASLSKSGIFANFHSNGNMFSDSENLYGLIPYYDSAVSAQQPTSVFDAGIWIGGVDPGGNLKLARQDYVSAPQNSNYYPGPLNDQGLLIPNACQDWDKVFYVTAAQITAHRADFADDGLVQNKQPTIYGWPGRGNPEFEALNGFALPNSFKSLAPFFDVNNDGVYHPDAGDFPCVQLRGFDAFVPAEFVWAVFNSMKPTNALTFTPQIEVQLTAWTFGCTDNPALNNAVFTAHKVINSQVEAIDSAFFGIWTDFDLGCYTDDYMGCHPASSTFFAYNANSNDSNNCAGMPYASFGANPPVQAATFLNKPMHSFLPSSLSLSNGSTPSATYNALTGRWFDGLPITPSGTGYNPSASIATATNFAFSGDPREANQWSMRSAHIPLDDFKCMASVELVDFLPGAVEEIVTVWSTYNQGGDYLSNYQTMLNGVTEIQALYDTKFTSVCNAISATQSPALANFGVQPNPATTEINIICPISKKMHIEFIDQLGRVVMAKTIDHDNSKIEIAQLPSGIYVLKAQGFAPVKWLKL